MVTKSLRPCRHALLGTLLTMLLAGTGVHAQTAADPVPVPDDEGGRDWSATLGIDLGSLTSTRSLLVLGVAGGAAAWCWEETEENQSAISRSLDSSPADFLMDFGTLYGSGLVIGGAALAAASAGALTDSRGLVSFGRDLGLSFVYSSTAAIGLKMAFDRKRPSGGPWSFPSGHTTSAFCTVPVVWRHAGPWAGTGTACLAALTGLGRLEENKHYVSDIIFGAALGWVVGQAVVDQSGRSGLISHLAVTGDSAALAWVF